MTKVRVRVNHAAFRRLEQSQEANRLVRKAAEAVRDACNAESSWGGYVVEDDSDEQKPATAVVIDTAEPSTDERQDRMIRNLSAARRA